MSQSSGPPKPKRHKPKFKLESIHVDELLNAAGMSGFLGVLEPPQPAGPHLEKLASEMLEEIAQGSALPERYQVKESVNEKGIPVAGIPATGVQDTSTPVSIDRLRIDSDIPVMGVPVSGIPQSAIPVSSGPHPPIPETGIPNLPPPLILKKRAIRQATLVQDGHSLGEQRVYETLWDHAHPYNDQARIVTVGYRTLSQLSGLTVNNCKANIQALTEKLAIEERLAHTATQGTTYLVYNYNSILRRRRTAGLTHYIKTRGVQFVDPSTGTPLSQTGIPESGIPVSQKGVPESGRSGIPEPAPPSLERSFRQTVLRSPSSSDVTFLSDAISRLGASVDDDLAGQLIAACYAKRPEATVGEIRDFVELKLIQMGPEVRNPGGYLLTAVPKCFTGEFYRQYAEQQRKLREQAESQAEMTRQSHAATRAEMQRILDDPASSEEDRRFAERIIGQMT